MTCPFSAQRALFAQPFEWKDVRLPGLSHEMRRIEGEVGSDSPADNAATETWKRCSLDACKLEIRSPAVAHDCSERLGYRSRMNSSGRQRRHSRVTGWTADRLGMSAETQ